MIEYNIYIPYMQIRAHSDLNENKMQVGGCDGCRGGHVNALCRFIPYKLDSLSTVEYL